MDSQFCYFVFISHNIIKQICTLKSMNSYTDIKNKKIHIICELNANNNDQIFL